MQKVRGYLSDDGNFFKTAVEAKKHDAEMLIRAWCSVKNIDADKVIEIIEALADPIVEYVHAFKADKTHRTKIPQILKDTETPRARRNKRDKGGGEGPETLQQQQTNRREPVPNMGRRARTKSVLKHRSGDGIGSRGDDASGVRGDEDMAT